MPEWSTAATHPAEPRSWTTVSLESLAIGQSCVLGEYARNRLKIDVSRDAALQREVLRMTTRMIAKTAGPARYSDRRSATAEIVRFASWWDHFKATHRRRWWMSWRHWRINYVWREATAVAEIKVELTPAVVFPWAPDLEDRLGPAASFFVNIREL